MTPEIPSYRNATFTVLDNDARLRHPNDITKFSRFKQGETLPLGKRVGDFKVIPQNAKVTVHDVRTDSGRNTYVEVRPVDPALAVLAGWTKATNLAGQFANELVGFVPGKWDLEPMGKNYTVTDDRSLIRTPPPDFRSTGETIPVGTYVAVTARSTDTDPPGKHVRVSRGEIADGSISAVEAIGWTAASNLTEGCSPDFATDAWRSTTGPNACWRRGTFIGAKILVNIVGSGGQMEQLTLDSLEAYLKLRDAAARRNLTVAVNSGFRTFAQQKKLFDLHKAGRGALAASPGRSNHQHGQAFDLNTHGFDGDPLYDWLKKNGPKLGFIRTVNKEHWHWEFRPEEAAELAEQGRFKLSKVTT